MIEQLRNRLEELTKLEEIANQADEEYEAEPMSEEKEKAFNEAYQAEFEAFIAVSKLIVKMTRGQIDEKTAREMVRTKRNEILAILA